MIDQTASYSHEKRRMSFGPLPKQASMSPLEAGLIERDEDPVPPGVQSSSTSESAHSNSTLNHESLVVTPKEAEGIALSHAQKKFGLDQESFVVKSSDQTCDKGMRYQVHLGHFISGLEAVNDDLLIVLNSQGNILSIGSNFYRSLKLDTDISSLFNPEYFNDIDKWVALNRDTSCTPAPSNPETSSLFLSTRDSLSKLSSYLGYQLSSEELAQIQISKYTNDNLVICAKVSNLPKYFSNNTDVTITPAFLRTENGQLSPVHEFQSIQDGEIAHGYVSSKDGSILSLINWEN
ncbi:hypothetical protein AYI68_g7934 [Smittium mucronatum]|uniref:Uncharacterized protein n=1 Tax=Smittium mucronatum TaxID=133383 RepID=A0A1R0GMA2_9FUNG|nr:hypothetical protein AYI68_g7934 [Smittium mucronatum]